MSAPTINILADICACPPGECAAMWGGDDRGHCVNRLPGDVRTLPCAACGASSWHQDGECLRCRAIAAGRFRPWTPKPAARPNFRIPVPDAREEDECK